MIFFSSLIISRNLGTWRRHLPAFPLPNNPFKLLFNARMNSFLAFAALQQQKKKQAVQSECARKRVVRQGPVPVPVPVPESYEALATPKDARESTEVQEKAFAILQEERSRHLPMRYHAKESLHGIVAVNVYDAAHKEPEKEREVHENTHSNQGGKEVLSEYELQRQANIESNNKVLALLGCESVVPNREKKKEKKEEESEDDDDKEWEQSDDDDDDDDDDEWEDAPVRRAAQPRHPRARDVLSPRDDPPCNTSVCTREPCENDDDDDHDDDEFEEAVRAPWLEKRPIEQVEEVVEKPPKKMRATGTGTRAFPMGGPVRRKGWKDAPPKAMLIPKDFSILTQMRDKWEKTKEEYSRGKKQGAQKLPEGEWYDPCCSEMPFKFTLRPSGIGMIGPSNTKNEKGEVLPSHIYEDAMVKTFLNLPADRCGTSIRLKRTPKQINQGIKRGDTLKEMSDARRARETRDAMQAHANRRRTFT